MPASIGVMIEGQEGLTWERWRHICVAVDELRFESLWRSDHCFSVIGEYDRDCIETWISLALCAEWTKRVTFGTNVSPITFRPPAVLARMATSVDILSGGRLVLGVGAGWYQAEHEAFHIPFPPLKERMNLRDEGIGIIREVWDKARPQPPRGHIPLLIGGSGEKRTLRTVASEADLWGTGLSDVEKYQHKCDVLAGYCNELRRDPMSIRRVVQAGCIIGRDASEIRERAAKYGDFTVAMRGKSPEEIIESARIRPGQTPGSARFVGTPEQVANQMKPYMELGVTHWQLHLWPLDDDDALHLMSEELAPRLL